MLDTRELLIPEGVEGKAVQNRGSVAPVERGLGHLADIDRVLMWHVLISALKY